MNAEKPPSEKCCPSCGSLHWYYMTEIFSRCQICGHRINNVEFITLSIFKNKERKKKIKKINEKLNNEK